MTIVMVAIAGAVVAAPGIVLMAIATFVATVAIATAATTTG
ncbi:MAG TPA: hypothetical protein VFW64_07235 [Pseudonocardiaceae bacterium]|nr:hypothetical protein [Pseudonocardiaceae bacterium]